MRPLPVVPVLVGLSLFAFADTIPPGTQIRIRTDRPIDASTWDPGRIYPGYVAQDVYDVDGDLAIPRGAYAEMIVRRVGPGQLTLDLESMTTEGVRYVMDVTGPRFNMPRDDYQAGSGLVATIAGTAVDIAGAQISTQGSHISVPTGCELRFRLQEPLHAVNSADPGYMRNGNHYHYAADWYR
jgi:hypothetical protein